MKVALWLLLLLPSVSWAHFSSPEDLSCEALLANEFNHAPDDTRQGLVTQNVPLTVESLISAYSRGIFPWGVNMIGFGRWHRPPIRGVLFLDQVHIGRSDRKYLRQALASGELTVTFDKDFLGVMEACATVDRYKLDRGTGRRVKDDIWISSEFKAAYQELHRLGMAHSVEVWRGDQLVGGLYGTFVNGVFTGESMFHLEPDVNKLAYAALIKRLQDGGHQFIDTQVIVENSLVEKWGAQPIPRAEFEERLTAAQQQNLEF